jgi:hypothetical protein
MTARTKRKRARPSVSPPMDPAKLNRLAKNLAELLADLLQTLDTFASRTKPSRLRILADLKSLLSPLPPAQRGCVWSEVIAELEKEFRDPAFLSVLGASLTAKARAKHTVKIDGVGNCLGSPGAGVNVTVDNVIAGACVTGSLSSGPTGGGVSGGFRY